MPISAPRSRTAPRSRARLLAPLLAAFALAALALAAPAPAAAQQGKGDPEAQQQVLATMQKLWQGMRTRDTTLLKSVFADEARLYGIRQAQDGTQTVRALPASDFIAAVAKSTRGPWIERTFNPEVRIDDTVATIWAEYDFHLGSEFSHCGIDALQLLRTSGGWKIVSIEDTQRKEGCTRRPPPQE